MTKLAGDFDFNDGQGSKLVVYSLSFLSLRVTCMDEDMRLAPMTGKLPWKDSVCHLVCFTVLIYPLISHISSNHKHNQQFFKNKSAVLFVVIN